MSRPYFALVVAALVATTAASGAERPKPRAAASAHVGDGFGDGWFLRGATDVTASRDAAASRPAGSAFGALALSSESFAPRERPFRLSGDLTP